MPIKPENRGRYPSNWKQIRASILERAGHKCEKCRAPNSEMIVRGSGEDADKYMTIDGGVFDAETGKRIMLLQAADFHPGRSVRIVLTISHLDHTPENCALDNLRALCQRCHLRYDAVIHAQHARETRRYKVAMGDLFAEADHD